MKHLTAIVFALLLSVQISFTQPPHSVARSWVDFTVEAIRNDLARPTVHARNLWHLSVVMYDAWAAYDLEAEPCMLGNTMGSFTCAFDGVPTPTDIEAAREEAIAHAAFTFLRFRYRFSPGYFGLLTDSQNLMTSLGYNPNNTSLDYTSGDPAALGNYIGKCMNDFGLTDGANEIANYGNQYYSAANPPMNLSNPGNPTITDLNRWQPLSFSVFVDQSGNVIPGGTPPFLSPEWGNVLPFALDASDVTSYSRDGDNYNVYHDPGPPPLMDTLLASDEYKWGFSMVALWSGHLDHTDGVMWDISPGAIGNISDCPASFADYPNFYDYDNGGILAAQGHAVNPHTGAAYTPNLVSRGDYGRVIAEYWADGPDSETPPGHWFALLNEVMDSPFFTKNYRGIIPYGDLEYDVKAYFCLGGAMHDAAITAWSIKGWYDYLRPISAIRAMAENGQCTDNTLPNYSNLGIPLVPGKIEVVNAGDPLAGAMNEHVGKIKIFAWRGHDYIMDATTDIAGVDWVLAENWWTYQRPSFVTPNFAGYISGHSTFSRAAAEVLTTITGDNFFPGGIHSFTAPQDAYLAFEKGPSQTVKLEWATYQDAADQSALSRIWGGIHPPADDIPGRKCGIVIADKAITKAEEYFFNDQDGDGFGAALDCNDNDPNIINCVECELEDISFSGINCASDNATFTITVSWIGGPDPSMSIIDNTALSTTGNDPAVDANGSITFSYNNNSAWDIQIIDTEPNCTFDNWSAGPIDCFQCNASHGTISIKARN